jgi:hypothetical protein
MGNKCIIVSNEIFKQYFEKYDNFDTEYQINIVYNIPEVDIITLKRIDGDFPQDNSIDILLTNYLESCIIINNLQEFTLHFYCNDKPFKNYITFQISNITYKSEPSKNVKDRIEEIKLIIELNKNLNNMSDDCGLDNCTNKVINFNWFYSINALGNQQKLVGLVANNEVKIDFVVTESIHTNKEPNKEIIDTNKEIIDSNKENILNINEEIQEKTIQLTTEELRQKRLLAFSKNEI